MAQAKENEKIMSNALLKTIEIKFYENKKPRMLRKQHPWLFHLNSIYLTPVGKGALGAINPF